MNTKAYEGCERIHSDHRGGAENAEFTQRRSRTSRSFHSIHGIVWTLALCLLWVSNALAQSKTSEGSQPQGQGQVQGHDQGQSQGQAQGRSVQIVNVKNRAKISDDHILSSSGAAAKQAPQTAAPRRRQPVPGNQQSLTAAAVASDPEQKELESFGQKVVEKNNISLKPGGSYKTSVATKEPGSVCARASWDNATVPVSLEINSNGKVFQGTKHANEAIAIATAKLDGAGKVTVTVTNTGSSATVVRLVVGTIAQSAKQVVIPPETHSYPEDGGDVDPFAGARSSVTGVPTEKLLEMIRERYDSEVKKIGQEAFGNARPGIVKDQEQPECVMQTYDRAAISAEGDTTRLVTGQIYDKWLLLSNGSVRLGCPTSSEHELHGIKVQSFRRGRIFTGLPTGSGILYVPQVFIDAVVQLHAINTLGVPLEDPKSDPGKQLWMFQQFQVPGRAGLASTIEIAGDPPTLWVATHSMHLARYFKDKTLPTLKYPPEAALSKTPPDLTGEFPIVWVKFDCETKDGPCKLAAPPTEPFEVKKTENCMGASYPLSNNTEWAPVHDNFTATSTSSIIHKFHWAGVDNPITHECLKDWATTLSSDYNIDVLPYPQFNNTLAQQSQSLPYGDVEFERCFTGFFFENIVGIKNGQEDKLNGDLVFAAGRLIMDCGHPPFHSETHPPSVLAHMRINYDYRDGAQPTCQPAGATGERLSGGVAMEANILVDGYFSGDPIEVDLFPPPRPSADARLVVAEPSKEDAALNVDYRISQADNHVTLTFSAPPRRPVVLDSGEVIWRNDRAYYGRWYIYWETCNR